MKIRNRLLTLSCVGVLALSGCATDGESKMTNAQKGLMIGAATGALAGLLAKDKKKGALIGAVGGGIAGAAVGNYMDEQKANLEKNLKEERESGAISVDKMEDDMLMVRMTSQTSFASGSSEIQPAFQSTMDKIADVVTKYNKTQLQIIGHTDSTGSDDANQKLSEARAKAVSDYLATKGVVTERLGSTGKGESMPIADNESAEGRSSNRRVEIVVIPIVEEAAETDSSI